VGALTQAVALVLALSLATRQHDCCLLWSTRHTRNITQTQTSVEALLCPHAVASVLPTLFEAMVAQKWQTNEGACKLLQVRCLLVLLMKPR
jgi:hypothetical protein